MTQDKLVSLLGRPLSPTEVTNFDLYLEIANDSLSELLCSTVEAVTEERDFETREGFQTVFTDIFSAINSVAIDGTVVPTTEYSVRQWDRRSGNWFNSIVFKQLRNGVVTIDADWGFDSMPADLQLLLAKLFAQVSFKQSNSGNVASKQVEDFRVTFKSDVTSDEQLALDYADTISKYSLCGIGGVSHGRV